MADVASLLAEFQKGIEGKDTGLGATVKFDFEGAGCIYLDGKSSPNTVSDEDKDADDGDDDYMVGLETWWGKRAARAGRASMTNPQATLPYTDQVHPIDLYKDIGILPYTDQVHLIDLFKDIGLRVALYTDVTVHYSIHRRPHYCQPKKHVFYFFTNIMMDSSLDGDRHPCLTIICFYMKHTVVPSINMCAGVWSIVHVNYCHTDLLTMFFTA